MSLSIHTVRSVFQHPQLGTLIIRASIGLIMGISGWNKFMAGEGTLKAVGSNISRVGFEWASEGALALFFGIMAAGTELLGGLFLLLGLFFRTSTALLIVTMLVATITKYQTSSGDFIQYGYPLAMFLVLCGLLLTGPGRFAVQRD